MTRILLCVLLATVVAPAHAQQSANLEALSKQIRTGQIDVGKQFSMQPGTGRFHKIHSDTLGMNCSSCHLGEGDQGDLLSMRATEPLRKGVPGRIDPGSCLGCHQRGGTATPWYAGRSAK